MKVDPITEVRDIKSIKKMLMDNPRDRLLFILGINSGLRVQDLLSLKVEQIQNRKIGDRVSLKEKKTGKENILIINKEIKKSFDNYCSELRPEPHYFIFRSRKGVNQPITTYRVTRLVKSWAEQINLSGNYGAHTLRKTWAYQSRINHGISWEIISKRLNHSSPSITRRYIGVRQEEVEDALMNEI